MAFKKATKRDARVRFAIMGPAGSGKTRTALEIATRLGRRVAVIDSEGGRSRAYCGLFDFDVDDELPDYSPESYVKAIKAAEAADYDVIVVDSASHEWAGKGGVLGKVDQVASRSGNKFTAWAVGTPAHQSFIDAVLQCRKHIILTLRSKTEWVLETNERGKQAPRAIGLGAVAREGTEYEVDFVGLMDLEHTLTMIKTTNFAELEGMKFSKPGDDLAGLLLRWLSENTVPVQAATAVAPEAGVPAVAPPAIVTIPPPAAVPTKSVEDALGEQIDAATSIDALAAIAKAVGPAVKAGHLSADGRARLVVRYNTRETALRSTTPTQQEAAA